MSRTTLLLPPGLVASYLPRLVPRFARAGPDATDAHAWPFRGAVMLADLSGFTALTERLARRGPAGAEELTRLLNSYFGPLIDLVLAHGGDVAKFAGDAMVVVWPEDELGEGPSEGTLRAIACGAELGSVMADRNAVSGERLALRVAIGAGDLVLLRVGGVLGRWEQVITGPALTEIAPISHAADPGQVVLTGAAAALVSGRCELDPLSGGCGRLVALARPLPVRPAPDIALPARLETDLAGFLPGSIRARVEAGLGDWLGELRRVTVLFVNLPELGFSAPLEVSQQAILRVQASLYRHEGSLNKLSVDEKGVSLVAVFGLPPLAHEDDPARGVRAALAILGDLRHVRARGAVGVASGRAFCGEVGNDRRREYTVMGDVVNLAARLMQKAPDQVVVDETSYRAARSRVRFEALPPIPLKGKEGLFAVFRPLGDLPRIARAEAGMVGRRQERLALEGCLVRICEGGGGTFALVTGAPGIGKSRLVGDLLERARARGVTALVGGADPVEASTPYYAWRPVFGQIFGLQDDTGAALPDLGARQERVRAHLVEYPRGWALAPLLDVVLPLGLPETELTASLEGSARAAATRDLLAGLVARAAGLGPVLLVLEDVHWLDPSSWGLLAAVRKLAPGVLLVATSRAEAGAAGPALASLLASPDALTLSLGGLAPDDTISLACRRLGVRALPEKVADFLADRSGGNPLFGEELALALRDAGILGVAGAEAKLVTGILDLHALDLPAAIGGVVTGRIDGLPPLDQLVLKVASAIGRKFSAAMLAAVFPLERDRPAVPDALQRIEEAGLAFRETTGPEPRFAFSHAITQEVAYSLLLVSQRQGLHRGIAGWYEEHLGEETALHYPLLAHHWRGAGDRDLAGHYLELAGRQALDAWAATEAEHFFVQARDLLGAAGGERAAGATGAPGPGTAGDRHARILTGLGHALRHQSKPEAALAEYQRAAEAVGGGGAPGVPSGEGDPGLLSELETGMGICHLLLGLHDEALGSLDRAAGAAVRAQDDRALLRAIQTASRVHYKKGEPLRTLELCRQALDVAERTGNRRAAAHAMGFSGLVHVSVDIPGMATRDRIREGRELLAEAVELARDLADPAHLNSSLNLLGNAQWYLGEYRAARETFLENLRLVQAIGAHNDAASAGINVAIMAHELGSLAEMASLAGQAAAWAQEADAADLAALAQAMVALARAWQGRKEAAAEQMAVAEDALHRSRAGPDLLIGFFAYRAELDLLLGDMPRALQAALTARNSIAETGIREYEHQVAALLGTALARSGEPAAAHQALQECLERAREVGSGGAAARALVGLAGLNLEDAGDPAGGPRRCASLAAEAFALARDCGANITAAGAALLLGRAARAMRDGAGATRWFGLALEVGLEAGCAPICSDARIWLDQAAV